MLIAVGGACVLTAVTGARRTQTAMRRFVGYSHPVDLSLFFDPTPGVPARVLSLPQVARVTRLPYLMISTTTRGLGATGVFGAADTNYFRYIDRPIVLRGRLADPGRPDEAVVNDRAERQEGLHLGSDVRLYAFSRAQVARVSESGFRSTERPRGTEFRVRIVGVIREPTDVAVVPIAQGSIYDLSGSLYTTPAFMQRSARSLKIPFGALPGNEIVRVRLRHGAGDVAAFRTAATRVGGEHVQILPGSDARVTQATVQRGINVEAIALLAFAGLATLALIVLVGIVVSRMMRVADADFAALHTLGMTRWQMFGAAVAWPVVGVFFGCIAAIAIAITASPLTPVGIARQTEIHPGFNVNVAVLTATAGLLLAFLVATVVLNGLNTVRTRDKSRVAHRRRTRPVPDLLRRWDVDPSAMLGINAAFGPQRDMGALRRSTVVAM